jgi:2-polyprenyl-3-methyl-5-hydroxy-6-metoxy-1,4-benzoquinol methylase
MKALLKRLSAHLQTSTESYRKHNAQYEEPGKIEVERAAIADYTRKDMFNGPELKLGQLLARYPEVRELAVDIGSGNGWISGLLAKSFSEVIAIEPSAAAIAIAKQLHPSQEYLNITWRQGFAETVLAELQYPTPVLFVTGGVLSHLRDQEVEKICACINKGPVAGSILAFNEGWGEDWHQLRWHIRTKEWWQNRLSNWAIDFHGPEAVSQRYHLGFHAVKSV